MVAQLEPHVPRIAAVAICLVLALWLAGQGGQQGKVRDAGDALAAGDREHAVALARELDGRPASLRALTLEADALTQLGRHDEAATALARAIDLAPNDWRLRRSYAVALAESGRVEIARRQLARAEVLNPRIVISGGLPR